MQLITQHSSVDSILASHPAAPGLTLSVPNVLLEFLDVAETHREQSTAQSVDSAKNASNSSSNSSSTR